MQAEARSSYRVIGIESSPYSVKVRAVLRYRRLPCVWLSRMPPLFDKTKGLRPSLAPVVQFPDGTYRVDSTPIILDLEARHPGERSVIPTDPADAFLALLIEDMADEWLTKSLFHFRFSRDEDARYGAGWVVDDTRPGMGATALEAEIGDFIDRQRDRMPLVGCLPANGPLLEDTYARVLGALEPFVATERFLFGSRPSIADFGLYGQLHTLASDPTPMAIMRATAPRTERWTRRMHDLSGVDGSWRDPEQALPGAVRRLLALAGSRYLPFLLANAAALDRGEPELTAEIDGHAYVQPPFRYQAKCLATLRERYAALDEASRARLDEPLGESGCLEPLAA